MVGFRYMRQRQRGYRNSSSLNTLRLAKDQLNVLQLLSTRVKYIFLQHKHMIAVETFSVLPSELGPSMQGGFKGMMTQSLQHGHSSHPYLHGDINENGRAQDPLECQTDFHAH